MWSNISAPKSGLKAAQVGHQVKQQDSSVLDQQENNQELSNPYSSKTVSGSPLMRYKHAVCSSQSGFIYIHGGRFSNGVPLDDDVWRFDPHENRWLQLKTSGCRPPSLQEHTLSEYQEQLYLFGGQVSAASGQENFFWRLDLAKCQWTSLSMDASNCSSLKFGVRLGPTNRRGHSACVYRDSIYIFGGYEDFRGSTNQLWQYDLLNERWELRNLSSSSACHPEPRHNHSAVIYQDSMFIYGGLSNLKPLGDLWRWSWKDKRWFREKTRGQSPGQLHGHTAIQAFGSMFVFGGERQNGRTTRSLWRLNLSNLCWQKIKPKGPRPNPTTWHAAIANPLGILDEANYLIEGDASDLEMDQQQQQLQDQPHEELVLFVNQQQRHHQQSLSDNSFSTHMQQTIPMETIRPITLNNTDNHHHQQQQHKLTGAAEVQLLQQRAPRTLANNNNHHHQQRTGSSRLKVSKSSSEQMSCLAKQAASQTGLRDRVTKPKRRLRLSFLRRNNSKNKKGCEAKQLPTSWSAASILNASSISGASSQQQHRQQPNESVAQKRHSVAIPETSAISVQSANDIEMVNLDLADGCGAEQPSANQESINETNVSILDNLDSDIKGMFQRAMSPADGEHDDHHQEALATTRAGTFKRDSMTQSQLSSCIGPATTQTYQTAREQLSSQSTLTITLPGDELKQSSNAAIVNTASNNKQLADVRQRKSMHQLNQSQLRRNTTNEGQQQQQLQRTTRGRPKSEIVQSLIDRADARIKHLYTPYFNPDANQQHQHQAHERNGHEHHQQQQQQKQQLPPRFSSNDPILGELANHRMFERSDSNGRRAVGLDKSKRHTIHQTMTYYNLYFAEDRRLDGSSGADSSSSPPATSDEAGGKQQGISPMEKDNVNATNTNSSSNGTNDKSLSSGNNQYANNSTSAALIGVHDGASSSGGDSSQRTLFLGRLESEVGSLMASSDSRTLCADLNNGGAHFRHNNKYQKPDCHEAQDREQNGFGSSQRMSESVASDELNNAADNTSLSFSVIAEFEEDDMLQYSSPTDLVMERRSRRSGRDDDEEEEDVRDNDYQEEEGSMQEEHQEPEESHDNLDDRMASDEKHQTTGRMKIPQKSSSSGYDSIQSAKSSNIDRDRQQQHHDTSSYSACSTGDSPQVSNSCLNHNNNPNHNNNRQCDDSDEKHFRQTTVIKREPGTMNANMTNTTTASSTTTESLALTTNDTNTSEFCPLTPPSKSLPSSPPDSSQISGTGIDTSTRQHSSFASSLMSGPSRLFGKKKTTKTRYWQLCMFVIGGKQQGGNHNAGNLNEPIAIWRLYI